MRHWNQRVLAAGLCLSLLMGQAAWASDALGHDLHGGTVILSEGTASTKGYFWSDTYGDLRTERYVSYTPNETVRPTVAYGETVLSRETLSTMAKRLEEQGKRVVGGTNGDFYVMSTGQPLGMVVSGGVLRSSSSYHSAIGFREDGTAFVGTPNLYISVTMGEDRLTVFGGLNKIRQVRTADGGGLTLLTPDFGESTQNISPGVDVFLRVVTTEEELGQTIPAEETGVWQELRLSDQPRIGGRVKCVVDYVSEAAGPNPIPEDGFVLTMNGKDDEGTLNMLRALQPGDEMNLDIISEDTRWNEATEALGAMYRLLDNGQVGSNLSTERTARTAIGIQADGGVIFYTMDGKQPGHSVGATCAQVAQRLLELGCVEAVGLDGGGSTTLGLTTPAQESMTVVNRPSDGGERKNSTAIFLTTELEATGEPGYLQVEPGDALALGGTELSLEAYEVDTGYRLMGLAGNVSYEASGGTVEGNIFTAGKESGAVTITARQEELTGTARVTVVGTPDEILVMDETTGSSVGILALEPGESVPLQAVSSWRKMNLRSQDTCYTWSCDEAVGTVTADGYFTAGERTAEGSLYVAAGEKTVTIPVSVAGHILPLEDFEGESIPYAEGPGTVGEVEKNLAYVRMGRQSLKVSYEIGEAGSARLPVGTAIPAGERFLGLWVYGDGSANEMKAVFPAGEERLEETVCTLDFTGWRHVLTAIPAGASALEELQIGGEGSGTVWLDQLTTSNEELFDDMAPVIQLKLEGSRLTATVTDNVDKSFAAPAVALSFDGATLPGEWDPVRGTLTAELPLATREAEIPQGEEGQAAAEPQPAHRISVTAVDVSGNLGRASLDVPGDRLVEFEDMADHWAAGYVSYLHEQGITNGVAADEGLYYLPNNTITRAEFFTMVARWMGLDLSQYAGVELPFADTADIPEWALGAVKAMYARGIVQGSMDYGVLYAYPGAGISRGEVMTILGRTQLRGWPEAELDGFTDGGETPEWAESYVRSLVGQGIINGYEDGTLKPNASMMRGEVAKVLFGLR
ncbi:MAG: hypothetical protein HFF07_07745 [Oscillospiraceae bacterium]|nr:hypothetical protein [Oscillospiraceae bacterium]